jgi:hypothetical protein
MKKCMLILLLLRLLKESQYKKNVQGTTRIERDCLLAAIQEAVWLLVETVTE